jgi:hypothetical protein
MASAQLPTPTLTAEERDQIVAAFGGADEFTAALAGWITDEVERRAAATAREAANVAVREAVEQAAAILPVSVKARPVEVKAEPVEVEAVKG